MKEHGMIFKGPLVRAIMEGTKTQTRRLPSSADTLVDGKRVSAKAWKAFDWDWETARLDEGGMLVRSRTAHRPAACPYRLTPKWEQDDVLWVRETWQACEADGTPYTDGFLKVMGAAGTHVAYRADSEMGRGYYVEQKMPSWRPSIFMPRWASRLTLRVKRVWPERVQEITREDVHAEGTPGMVCGKYQCEWCNGSGSNHTWPDGCPHCEPKGSGLNHTDYFRKLWNEINGPRGWGWELNRPVWCIEFERVKDAGKM